MSKNKDRQGTQGSSSQQGPQGPQGPPPESLKSAREDSLVVGRYVGPAPAEEPPKPVQAARKPFVIRATFLGSRKPLELGCYNEVECNQTLDHWKTHGITLHNDDGTYVFIPWHAVAEVAIEAVKA